jgi:signal transduction histidine kinase
MLALVERTRLAAASLRQEEFIAAMRQGQSANVGLAPERTGRTSHAIDVRADLYAFGAMAYEWVTGHPPFGSSDPLRLLHAQLAAKPPAPDTLRPEVPKPLSDIILRLLEKEPERRYQSVEGLVHDLDRLLQEMRSGGRAEFQLGEGDFPARLSTPHSVGRDAELGQLRASIDAAARGEFRAFFIAGPAGVGKTTLIDEAHAFVAQREGRFAMGKFPQFGSVESSALLQALRALGRLLLAEPEEKLRAHRELIAGEMGANAQLMAVIPEFSLLLGLAPEISAGDPTHAMARAASAELDLLRAVARTARPLVLVLDDLQWCDEQAVRFLDGMFERDDLGGIVLICAMREDEIAPAHPVARALPSWLAARNAPQLLRLENLDCEQLSEMLMRMLRLPPAKALQFAQAVVAHTGGNPFDTVEFVNALRGDGLIRWDAQGWHWSDDAIDRYVGGTSVVDLLAARIARLAGPARELLEALACIQSEAGFALASVACAIDESELLDRARVLVHEGLVTLMQNDPPVLRLRHDRVQQAVYGALPVRQREELHLALARRFAPDAGMEAVAADQYVAAGSALDSIEESVDAAALLHRAAAAARSTTNFIGARRMLETALTLLDGARPESGQVARLRESCLVDLHFSLFSMSLFAEGDEVYGRIGHGPRKCGDDAAADCTQIESLRMRGRMPEAVELGLVALRRLGVQVPQRFDDSEVPAAFERLRPQAARFDLARELARADADAQTEAIGNVLACLVAPAFYSGFGLLTWLVVEAAELWESKGPSAPLAKVWVALGTIGPTLGDWRSGHATGAKLLAFCEARQWTLTWARCTNTLHSASTHWQQPLELSIDSGMAAREYLVGEGCMQGAGVTYRITMVAKLECAATLDSLAAEVRSALDLVERIGHAQARALATACHQLLKSLRGETRAAGSFDDERFDEAGFLALHAADPMTAVQYRCLRAIAAAVFGNTELLCGQVQAVENSGAPISVYCDPLYPVTWVHWLGAVGRAWQLRGVGASLTADASIEWLEGRAADLPSNFRHMLLHAQAERAWAAGDSALAARLFDEALCLVAAVTRPWHRAFITECAGRFHLADGRAIVARALLFEAERLYREWGAAGKSALLQRELGMDAASVARTEPLRPAGPDGEIDMLALLRAAQALGSEHSTAGLRERVEELLSMVCGADRVQLAIRDEDAAAWLVKGGHGEQVEARTRPDLAPLSALRYVERTREVLLVTDVFADDRFARDPYFRGLARCSLMVVPIVRQGATRAILFLENRSSRNAFNAARLDGVLVIAAQLAVSLESAQLYERLERKVAEQTNLLRDAQSRLVADAHRAGMAQIATNVLHNVGNVLTSVNVSARLLEARVRESRTARVSDIAQLLSAKHSEFARHLADDEAGKLLPRYVQDLARALDAEREELLGELRRLSDGVEHITNVVAVQQSYAGTSGMREDVRLAELLDNALRLQDEMVRRCGVNVLRSYDEAAPMAIDKTRVLQILVNLIENACHAMEASQGRRELELRLQVRDDGIRIAVADTGSGIAHHDLPRIFSHGFTTKAGGHGFGLHACAIAAGEMGGTLAVSSDGPGAGATFTLWLPHAA